MTDSKLWDNVYEYIDNLAEPFDLVRNYRDNDGGDVPYQMCDFDDELDSYYPSDIARMVTNGDYDDGAEYFTYDSYAISTYYSVWDICDIDDVVSFVVNNDDDLGDSKLREILDAKDDEAEITIWFGDTPKTYTLETFKEEFGDTNELFYDTDGNIYYPLGMIELFEEAEDNGIKIFKLDIRYMLESKDMLREATIVGYDGYVFGDKNALEDGRRFVYFYEPTKQILLKLVYNGNPNLEDRDVLENPRYIIHDKANSNISNVALIIINL